jgi:hypothetical protein
MLLSGLSTALFTFSGSTAAFPPSHAARAATAYQQGFIDINPITTIFFRSLTVILMYTTEISALYIMKTPTIVFLTTASFFLFLWTLSERPLLSAVLTAIYLLSGSTGTPKLFLYAHGMGSGVVFLCLANLYRMFEGNWTKRREILQIVLSVALVFISYDRAGELLLIYGCVTLLFFIIYGREELKRSLMTVLSSQVLMVVAIFGLTPFVYDKVIPLFANQAVALNAFDKLLLTYFQQGGEGTLAQLYISRPGIISIALIAKYALLGVSALFFAGAFFTWGLRSDRLPAGALVPAGLLGYATIWLVLRFLIGQFAITVITLPVTVALLWLIGHHNLNLPNSETVGRVGLALVILISVVNAGIVGLRVSNGVVEDRNVSNVELKYVSSFLYSHDADIPVRSDVKTWFKISLNNHVYQKVQTDPMQTNVKSFRKKDIQSIVKGRQTAKSKLFILNFQRDVVTLLNWVSLKPWTSSEERIQRNTQISKVYTSDDVTAYYSPANSTEDNVTF